MILYKYVDCRSGMKILESNSIGFRQPSFFNDPFELTAAYSRSDHGNMFVPAMAWAKQQMWAEKYAVLSLTRSPLNPLMWAHYGDSHQGFVIGIDVTCKLLSGEQENYIPVQYGNVIYTESKPVHDFVSKFKEPLLVGSTYEFNPQHYEKTQRLFLHKPMYWSYEEEVRVVKCIHGYDMREIPSGTFDKIETKSGPLYLTSLPKSTIKEVYVGARSPLAPFGPDFGDINEFVSSVSDKFSGILVHACYAGDNNWGLESKLLKNG